MVHAKTDLASKHAIRSLATTFSHSCDREFPKLVPYLHLQHICLAHIHLDEIVNSLHNLSLHPNSLQRCPKSVLENLMHKLRHKIEKNS